MKGYAAAFYLANDPVPMAQFIIYAKDEKAAMEAADKWAEKCNRIGSPRLVKWEVEWMLDAAN